MCAASPTHSIFATIQLRAKCWLEGTWPRLLRRDVATQALRTAWIEAQLALEESETQHIRHSRLNELEFSTDAGASVQSVAACATSGATFEMSYTLIQSIIEQCSVS